jgi:hypothetical protein
MRRFVRHCHRVVGGRVGTCRIALECPLGAVDNSIMILSGRVHNGVVVFEGEAALPEGVAVTVHFPAPTAPGPAVEKKRISVPLVRTGEPGSVPLTGERIAEILDEEDAAAGR